MRVLGMMVTRNEADRYLRDALRSLTTVCDEAAVFDDQSDDATAEIAAAAGAHVRVRGDHTPPFVEHEGRFRRAGWEFMEHALHPEQGDWVLSLDADELLVGDLDAVRASCTAAFSRVQALNFPIRELWSLDPPQFRVDGWWGSITGARLYRWARGAMIADKAMASGSIPPTSVQAKIHNVEIAHLGYVRPEDRQAKYDRYRNRPGHSRQHVESIVALPTLRPISIT